MHIESDGSKKHLGLKTLVALGILLHIPSALADLYTPSSISSLTSQSAVDSVLSTFALGADHRDYQPASSLGITFGFDLGLALSVIRMPSTTSNILTSLTGQSIPAYIPVPRLVFHKGFPYGIDIGFSYFGLTSSNASIKMYGGEIQWAFLRDQLVLPSLAIRASGNYSSLGFIDTHTYKLDLIASQKFLFLEPYVGVGAQNWSGNLHFLSSLGSLPASVNTHSSGSSTHYFGGLQLKLPLARITVEGDYNSVRLLSYGMKFSVGF